MQRLIGVDLGKGSRAKKRVADVGELDHSLTVVGGVGY
jgi:hypothetical protein